MSSRSEEEQATRARTRKRLIDNGLERMFEARAACQRERLGYGDVDEVYRANFQQAILDLYWALRPLRNEDAVDEWWDEVELSEEWTEVATSVEGEVYGQGVSVERDTVPKQGLETLRKIDGLNEHEERRVETFRGERTEVVTRPHILPYDVLVDISGVLEDAAAKLGFNPSVAASEPRTEITDEMLKEVKQWREENL